MEIYYGIIDFFLAEQKKANQSPYMQPRAIIGPFHDFRIDNTLKGEVLLRSTPFVLPTP